MHLGREMRIVTGRTNFSDEVLNNLIQETPVATDFLKEKDDRLNTHKGDEAIQKRLAEMAERLGLKWAGHCIDYGTAFKLSI